MTLRNAFLRTVTGLVICAPCIHGQTKKATQLPSNLQTVLENTTPLPHPRGTRLPLYVLPISNSLSGIGDKQTEKALRDLNRRGISYTVDWNPGNREASLAEALRIGTMQQRFGLEVSVNANACLYSFFDGSDDMLHVDDTGNPFAETSFGNRLGCPFAIEPRYPVIRERVETFLRDYKKAEIEIDFIFADWEIDGPIEWNDAWASSKKCRRCRKHVPVIDNFHQFQKQLRRIRSEMQRVAFGDNVTSYFPNALVGNYAVYPHDGYRYWYDYFEHNVAENIPHQVDQGARYREWFPEFDLTGYTFAMPVVYTWYRTFDWYDFDNPDYRWFYNMLRVGSNAGRHTPARTPIITFVHWNTTAPPNDPDPRVKQFSGEKYQELLWHLLLRGHDGLFLWCVQRELPEEVRLVHQVYAEALEHRAFLEKGEPFNFRVPKVPGPVVSGLKLGKKLLIRRTDFNGDTGPVRLRIDGREIEVASSDDCQIVDISSDPNEVPKPRHDGLLHRDGKALFPIGFYEFPQNPDDLAEAGVNLVRCGNQSQLDMAHAAGLMGWVSLGVQGGPTDALRAQIESLKEHPALAVWEGPDEIVWNFTQFSQLEKTAGFTREDWRNQTPNSVAYAEERAREIMPNIRDAIELIRELDDRNRPFWINEAADSDLKYVRQYMDWIDITGCDYYPVRSSPYDIQSIGKMTRRWQQVGRGKPVWMVLQAFSWHRLKPERGRRYPTFVESRFMAYDAIARGARGILYWGSGTIGDPAFRQSLYALTSELATLQPFLVSPQRPPVQAEVIEDLFEPPGRGVVVAARQHGSDFLLMMVNEDNHRHLGLEIKGLHAIEGRELKLLYGSETAVVHHGELNTRMQPYETKVFSTRRVWESANRKGRNYGR